MSVDATFYDTTTGELVATVVLADEAEVIQNVQSGQGYVLEELDPATQYFDLVATAPAVRPVVPVMTGATYDLSQLPAGGKIVVTDEEGATTDVPAQADTLELTDAGAYGVRSECPFPAIDFDTEVIVP